MPDPVSSARWQAPGVLKMPSDILGKDSPCGPLDGTTTFRAPDSTENRAYFGAQAYASGKVASYPQVRAVSVTSIPTHLVADMAFGQYGQNEMLYAKTLVEHIAEHSLTVFDRGFLCAEILLGLYQQITVTARTL